jgi:CelD/BcsL family acetyltransferase involved in cellulose biosynthesis
VGRFEADGIPMQALTTVSTVAHCEVDEALAHAWDELADRAGAVPFARPGWLRPWAEAAGVRLEALTTRSGPTLTGVLPIVSRRHHLYTPANWHTPWLEAVAQDDPARRALVAALAAARPTRVTVDFVLAGEPTAEGAGEALAAAGYHLHPRTRLESPFVTVQGTWEEYLASRSAHRRGELRRRTRRLEAAGEVTREVHLGGDHLPALLEEAFAVEAAGWKGTGGTAMLSDPLIAAFYRRVAAWGAERGWLRLAFLRLDGRPLAFDLALEAAGHHYLLKTGYDPAFTALSPGLLLRLHMLERAFRTGVGTYEFCGGTEPWKLEWASATRRVLVIEAFAPTVAGAACRTAGRIARFVRLETRRPTKGR